MVESQRHRDFQRLAVHLVKRSWPELQATEEQNDGGEDATSFGAGADGLRRSMAASLTGTLAKIRADAKRIKERGVNLGVLIFVTPVPVDNLTVTEWRKSVAEEFKHDLYVISQAEIITRLEQPENHRLCKEYLGLAIEADPSIAELERAVRQASANVLRGWKAANRYDDTKTIELTLFELPPPQSRNPAPEFRKLSLRDIFALVRQRGNGTLLGDPGAGKTFTLIQLAELLLQDSSAPIPILVPLAAWASSGHEFFSFLAIQLGISADAVAKLATLGSFAFLLNGWNEISEAGLERATAGLKTLPLNFPALPLIVSTRNSLQAPPFATPFMIQVAGLSHEQKVTIIRKSGLRDSAALIAELEANNSLLEITDTPLFLSASIAVVAAGERLPQSRYAILQLFVEHFEGNPDHAAGLKGPPCNSLHRQYLERIAVKMTESSGATLTFDEATDVIAQSSVEFQQRGHIGEISPSADILDRLVRHHMLVLTPNPGSSYRFAHQQYQEWFGAEALRHSIGEIIQNETAENRFAFQRDVLNRIQWVEPLLFLMDRLGGGNEAHLEAAARVIRWSMQVDLHLASELAGAAGRAVWGQVRDELGDLLRRWYEADGEQQRYCALSAMLATEAPDFQDILWPLLESTDRNIRLFTIRTRRNFPLSCLGPDWRAKFANWPAERQVEFIRELSWQSNREHIDFAVDILQTGKEPQVNVACFELLLDARAYETLAGNSSVIQTCRIGRMD